MWDELKAAAKVDEPIHILMRFSDKLHSVEDTIQAHSEVIKQHGAVWIGKLGKPLSHLHIKQINEQCLKGIPSYLYLVQNLGGRYGAYRGTVVEMSRTLPEAEEYLVPVYYKERGILGQAGFWTKVSRIESLKDGELNELHIATSGSSVPYTLATSIAALFVVREGRGMESF